MGQVRGQWGSRVGFILAAAGSAIGLGNLWKFPYVTWQNNGGGFVYLYALCVLIIGLPIMMAELLIGRRTQKSAVGGMREVAGPGFAWVGGLGVVTGFVILGYYAVIAGWTLRYIVHCLEWSFQGYTSGDSSGEHFGAFAATGWLQVTLAGAFMILTMAVVYKGVGGGIEKIARYLMPTLFVILLLLLGAALTMDGAGQTLRFLFTPRFDRLPPLGVLEALGQAFFSLSLGMGAMITYGSYLRKKDSLVSSAFTVVALDTGIAILAAVIMFSVIFSLPGMSDQIGKSTSGMLFITLPELFYTVVPFGAFLAPLFYVLVGFAALTSTISLLEVIVAYFIDQRGWSRMKATTACGVLCYLVSVLCGLGLGAIPALSNFTVPGFAGKQGFLPNLDHLASNWFLPVGGFFITIAVGWIMTRESTREELVDDQTPGWFDYGMWRFFIRWVAPAAVFAIIVAVLFGRDFS